MNSSPLSDADAQKLFASVSNNLNDPDKLSEILGSSEVPDPAPALEVTEVKQEEVVKQGEVQEEQKIS